MAMMNTPEGTRDLLYGECQLYRTVQQELTAVFQRCGYSEIATPVVEYYNVFSKAGRSVPEEGTLKMIDRQRSYSGAAARLHTAHCPGDGNAFAA